MVVRALPRLIRDIPDLHYLVVGKGDPDDLKALAASEGVADRITIVDYVSEGDLPTLYHLCDLYAMVSRWDPITKEVEGFGICYLEAGACGKPCVAGSVGGCGDAVEDGVTGLVVDPTDNDAVYEALRALLTDPDRSHVMGQAGRRRVKDLFTKEDTLCSTQKVLTSSIRPGPRVGRAK